MTNPMNYNQQLLSYLQAWRQLLEASAALTSGMPMGASPMGMPPMPPMPPMPFMPPMTAPGTNPPGSSPPADYSQQLFGYLQAWRQYLEHATSNASGSIQPLQPPMGAYPGSYPPGHPTGSQSAGYPSAASEPTDSSSTGSQATGDTGSESSATQSSGSPSSFAQKNDNRVVLRPKDPYGTITGFNLRGLREQLNRAETNGPGSDPAVGSAFAKKLTPEASTSPARGASLYGRAPSTPSPTVSTTVTGAGLDPRRAAPPATSKWWLTGQGHRPGIKEQRDPTRLVNIRPTDLGGRQ
jgi:hypothetical protein